MLQNYTQKIMGTQDMATLGPKRVKLMALSSAVAYLLHTARAVTCGRGTA
jgi:hypothetical protein